MDSEIWGSDHGIVDVLAVPGGVMLLVGRQFVFVPFSRAHQDMKGVTGEGTARMFVGSTQFQTAKLVLVRQGEAIIWTGGYCSRDTLVCLLYTKQ